jgi:hypothetical protein
LTLASQPSNSWSDFVNLLHLRLGELEGLAVAIHDLDVLHALADEQVSNWDSFSM